MASDSKIYDVLSVETYIDGNGEEKSRFHRVGAAFDNKNGGQTLLIPPGISLSGKIVTKERTEKPE